MVVDAVLGVFTRARRNGVTMFWIYLLEGDGVLSKAGAFRIVQN